MIALMQQQYALVQQTRRILFEYLKDRVGNHDLNRVFPEFADKSIRDLLEHTAGCYFSWIGFHALGYPRASFDHAPCTTIDLVSQLFTRVDGLMDEFWESFRDRMHVAVRTEHDPGEWITATPLALFTHVLTHEFHHKGQVVWIGRLMGYIPPDTDASNGFSWTRGTDAGLSGFS